MNKKLIIIALVLAFTIAKFDMRQKMIENASSFIHDKVKDFLSQENISQQDLEEFAKNNNLDIEKLTKVYQWKQKKIDIENAPELTEEQKDILKQKFMQLKSQNLSFEEIKSEIKQFAEQNGININSIKKHIMRRHQNKHREQSSEEGENEIQLTPEQINLIKNKFKELKQSGISMEEIKNQMRSFAEANNINPELLKKLCRKHREEQRRKEKGFLQNKKRDESKSSSESESSSESQSEEQQNGQKQLKLGKHDNERNQDKRRDERQNNFEERRGQHSEERRGQHSEERRGNRHPRDEKSGEDRQKRNHEERRDRRHNQDREDKNDRREEHKGKHQRGEKFERVEERRVQYSEFEVSEEFDI
ncbi:hypothetical protein TTHERM_00295010 (macronuclear) [Tetrahymena thermophila SB210]|uniref:Transmembrane protein n=1 Tax=Tetrahymena thermophila (strain SB210) TaxID=312017 RepID=I7MDX2_TETTS|nr:hypothetical protein TTHERM_00295010 [Tetrahymena thermophila SB210]EAR92888.3 hypothetical protein TTHERM_00295010 [Tetrahymena thermophila SB210]|eukprot:XP_001013133.3 hypothetical protein TTHERM_00295010 [Tetrahymena thermophila SB210]